MIAQDRPVAGRQWAVLALVLVTLIIDGVDTQLLSLVAPLIMGEIGVDKTHFGPAMSAALLGMALGAGIGGWLGDRLGRKTVLVAATLVFGLATAAVAVIQSLPLLVVLRLVSGLGFGAVAPNGAAMVSEWLPTRLRSRAMALLSITIPMGGLVGGSAVLQLLPAIGWRGCFVVCGAATLVVAAIVIVLMPESPAYLATRGRGDQARRLVKRVTGAEAVESGSKPAGANESVLTRANLRLNLGIWIAFFCLQLIAYGFISWTPVFLTMAGWPLETAIRGTQVFNLSAVAVSLLTGWLLEHFRFRNLAFAACLSAAVALIVIQLLLASFPGSPLAAFVGIGLVSAMVGIAIAGIYTFSSFAYPVPCRANGIGITLMAGRSGGIVIAYVGGMLLAALGDSTLPFFSVLMAGAMIAAASVFSLGRRYSVVLRQEGEALAERGASSA